MKNCIVLFCFLAFTAVALGRPEEHYTDKYDHLNLDEILSNGRLLEAYVNCLLDKGKCTAEGKELKSHIQEALTNNCEKCTDTQKKESRHVMGHLINFEPAYWKSLTEKYDPTNKYAAMYEKELKAVKAQAA